MATEHLELRPRADERTVAHGTLACPDCDAPVAPPHPPARVTAMTACPYCGRSGPLRAFLSFATPGRPARVVVRVSAGVRVR